MDSYIVWQWHNVLEWSAVGVVQHLRLISYVGVHSLVNEILIIKHNSYNSISVCDKHKHDRIEKKLLLPLHYWTYRSVNLSKSQKLFFETPLPQNERYIRQNYALLRQLGRILSNILFVFLGNGFSRKNGFKIY